MRDDARELFRGLGLQHFAYREVLEGERLARFGLPRAWSTEPIVLSRGPLRVRVVTRPGAGATTLVALLAKHWAENGQSVAIVEPDASGPLHRAFGATTDATRRLVRIDVVTRMQDAGRAERVLVDAPRDAVEVDCDVLVTGVRVGTDDLDDLAALHPVSRLVVAAIRHDARHASVREAWSALRVAAGRRLCPRALHEDTAVSLLAAPPTSQLQSDIAQLAGWLDGHRAD